MITLMLGLVFKLGPTLLILTIGALILFVCLSYGGTMPLQQNEYTFKVNRTKDPLKPGKVISIVAYIEHEGKILVPHPKTHRTVELTPALRSYIRQEYIWMSTRLWLIEKKSPIVDILFFWQMHFWFKSTRNKYMASNEIGKHEETEKPEGVTAISKNVVPKDEMVGSLLHRTQYTFVFIDLEVINGDTRISCFMVVRLYAEVTNGFTALFVCQPAGSFNDRMGGLSLEAVREYLADRKSFDDIAKEKTSFTTNKGKAAEFDNEGRPVNLYSSIMSQNGSIDSETGHSLLNIDFLEFGAMPGDKEIEAALKAHQIAELEGKADLTKSYYELLVAINKAKAKNQSYGIISSYPDGPNMYIAENFKESNASIVNFPNQSGKGGQPTQNITLLLKENEKRLKGAEEEAKQEQTKHQNKHEHHEA